MLIKTVALVALSLRVGSLSDIKSYQLRGAHKIPAPASFPGRCIGADVPVAAAGQLRGNAGRITGDDRVRGNVFRDHRSRPDTAFSPIVRLQE